MAAWKAGIVVVVSAGNSGPDPMTVEVPGNVPYVITVGALTDNNTPYNGTGRQAARQFSSTGPTFEGFVKPEIVSPGGHIAASMSSSSYLANIDPDSMAPGPADVHDVGHVAGGGGRDGCGCTDAAGGSFADAGYGEVPA